MQVSPHDIESLLELQQIDLDISHLNKQLEELPQRSVILEARQKRASIEGKTAKIDQLKKEAKKKLTRILDEDASLAKKENGVQAAIEAAGNDFRGVEARTKELNGIFKRRQALAQDKTEAEEELAKITALEEQVLSAVDECNAVEQNAVAEFKQQGGTLVNEISMLKSKRELLLANIDPQVSDIYLKTNEIVGNVTIGKLAGARCSVCRVAVEGGRLIELKSQAPLSTCPACGRLLIIEE